MWWHSEFQRVYLLPGILRKIACLKRDHPERYVQFCARMGWIE